MENCVNYKIHLSVRAKLIKSSHLDLQLALVQFLRGQKTSCPIFPKAFDGVKRTHGRQKPPSFCGEYTSQGYFESNDA